MAYPHTVLTAILDPLGECMTPDVAQRVIQLRASPEANIRMHLLAGKSAQGTLSEEEREENLSTVASLIRPSCDRKIDDVEPTEDARQDGPQDRSVPLPGTDHGDHRA